MMLWVVTSWAIVVLSVATLPLTRTRPARVRVSLDVVALGCLSVTVLPLVGSIVQPQFARAATPVAVLTDRLLLAAWWLLASRTLIRAGQWTLGANHQNHAARFASDLAAGAIYLGALLAIIDTAFGVSLTGLIATSGVIAIVLGLALQNTLGDLFSGMAVRLDRPFGIGDLIRIDDSIEGRIFETNWRSTRLVTGEGDLATVPNSVVAKSRVVNRSSPTETQNAKVTVLLDPAVLVERGLAVLAGAALAVETIGPARVSCTELRGDATTFDIHFSAPLPIFDAARSALLQQIARHTRYAGIALANHTGLPLKPGSPPSVVDLLDEVHVLDALEAGQRAALAPTLIRHQGDAGQAIFRQGGSVASLFILAEGTFEVSHDADGQTRRVGIFGPGDYFGELALLCGLPNAVTVTSLTSFIAFEMPKATLEPLLHENPSLAHALEQGANRAQALLHRAVAIKATGELAAGHTLLQRIRAYFAVRESAV